LDVKSFQTYGPAYDFLAQAMTLLDLDNAAELAPDERNNQANFVRCVSGAFHNLAALLYQEERYGPAVRFLKEGCGLGERALRMHGGGLGRAVEREEVWVALEQQLYRRWELLGVCYIKMGDRKVRCNCVVSVQISIYFSIARILVVYPIGQGIPILRIHSTSSDGRSQRCVQCLV
jgi:separase